MRGRFLTYRTLIAFTCQTPVFALFYLSRGLGYSELLFLTLAFAASKIVCDVPSGIFADRVGRKPAILLRVALEILSVVLLFKDQFLASAMLGGAAVAFSAGAEQAMVYEWEGPAFGRVFGRASFWGCVSTAVASVAGGALAIAGFGWVYTLRLVALVAAGFVVLTFAEPKRLARAASAPPTARPSSGLARTLAFAGLLGAVHVAALQLQQPFLKSSGLPLAAFGPLYVLLQVATAFGARFSHRFSAPLGVVATASAVGFALIGGGAPAVGIAALFLLKFAHGVSLPAFGAALNAHAPPSARATALSFRSMFEGAALLAVTPALGWTADHASLAAAFSVAALLVLPSFLLLETTTVRKALRIPLACLVLLMAGCSSVEYHEKEQLGRRIMQFDPNDLETSYQNKVNFSREVSGGRPGHSAGGGCGCGN